MGIFAFIGSGLLLLGSFAGMFVFLSSFEAFLNISVGTLWSLFILSSLGGGILFLVDSENHARVYMFKTVSIFHLILGLISALTLFLNAMNIVTANGTGSLWVLFLLCTLAGIVGAQFDASEE